MTQKSKLSHKGDMSTNQVYKQKLKSKPKLKCHMSSGEVRRQKINTVAGYIEQPFCPPHTLLLLVVGNSSLLQKNYHIECQDGVQC